MKRCSFSIAIILLSLCATALQAQRVRWETSKVVGSPDPQLPFTVQKTYTGIQWKSPIYALEEAGTNRLLVITQGGEQNRSSKILRIEDDPEVKEAELFYELSGRLLYGFTFHPKYRENGQVFVFSNGPTGNPNRINRISRLTLAPGKEQVLDPKSEHTIIEWPSSGHDGGDLLFGLDGMLYITTGDGTGDSDVNFTGQDISNLNGAVLRIDVDKPGKDLPYSIPKNNPFVSLKNARGECWAFGLRNPWRMSIQQNASTATPAHSSQTWAMLIKRIYQVDPLCCPEWGGEMKVVAFIEPPQDDVIEDILKHCGLWQASSARAPPDVENLVLDLDFEFSDSPMESSDQAAESQELLTYVDIDTLLASF